VRGGASRRAWGEQAQQAAGLRVRRAHSPGLRVPAPPNLPARGALQARGKASQGSTCGFGRQVGRRSQVWQRCSSHRRRNANLRTPVAENVLPASAALKSTPAHGDFARFPVGSWDGGKADPAGGSTGGGGEPPRATGGRESVANATGRATSLHLPVRDRALLPEQPVGGGKLRWERGEKKKKKLSKRQLANAARAKHRGTFFEQLMRELDPSTFSRNPHLDFINDPMPILKKAGTLYGDPEEDPSAADSWEEHVQEVIANERGLEET